MIWIIIIQYMYNQFNKNFLLASFFPVFKRPSIISYHAGLFFTFGSFFFGMSTTYQYKSSKVSDGVYGGYHFHPRHFKIINLFICPFIFEQLFQLRYPKKEANILSSFLFVIASYAWHGHNEDSNFWRKYRLKHTYPPYKKYNLWKSKL